MKAATVNINRSAMTDNDGRRLQLVEISDEEDPLF